MKTQGRGLSKFSVKNIGGIQQARLILRGNFIAVTGESGTGKSSLVRALEVLAGKRSQTASIRFGFEEGEVWGVFREKGTGSETVAGRILSRGSRNRNYLGEESVPFARLKDFTERRLGIQSQFSQLDLLDPRRQRDLLDSCGGEESAFLRKKLAADFETAIRLERGLSALQERRREIEKTYLDAESVIETVRRLQLKDGNEAGWKEELQSLEQFLSRQGKLREIAARFLGGSSEGGLAEELQRWMREMAGALDKEQETLLGSSFENLLKEMQKLEVFSRAILQDKRVEEAEERRELLENRLGTLRKLKRLVGAESLEELLAFCEKAEENLDWMQKSAAERESLVQRCRQARKEVAQTANALAENRRTVAAKLEETVSSHLADLAMENFHFGVSLKDLGKIPESLMGLDIGPKTAEAFSAAITRASTVLWNGPMGVFENPLFAEGTRKVAQSLEEATKAGCQTVVGGGDTAAAVNSMGFADKVTHVSTGGGASLEFFEGLPLPGIQPFLLD